MNTATPRVFIAATRQNDGKTTTSLGLIAASVRSGLPLVLASYPITPASELCTAEYAAACTRLGLT